MLSNKIIKNPSKYSIVSKSVYRNAYIMHPPLKLALSIGKEMYMRTSLS